MKMKDYIAKSAMDKGDWTRDEPQAKQAEENTENLEGSADNSSTLLKLQSLIDCSKCLKVDMTTSTFVRI